jgi:hypothetical protein
MTESPTSCGQEEHLMMDLVVMTWFRLRVEVVTACATITRVTEDLGDDSEKRRTFDNCCANVDVECRSGPLARV